MPGSLRTLAAVIICAVVFGCDCPSTKAEEARASLSPAVDCREYSARLVRKLAIRRGYHEGLYYDGKSIWVCNGECGKAWIVDISDGRVLSEIEPVGDFIEALSAGPDGTFYTTEWYKKSVYRVRIEKDKLVVIDERSIDPSHPAGAVWNGEKLFVVTWDRGVLGTKFGIMEMDRDLNILRKISIKTVQEACQLAWDGKFLWMTSWYDRRVYKIDVHKWEILGYFCSGLDRTTGVAWDGRYLWLTATRGDLYQMEVAEK